MFKKLIAVLVASAFAFTAFAQAPKSDTKSAPAAGTEAKKDTTAAPSGDAKPAKGEKKKGKAKAKGKGKAKSDEAKK